MGSDMNRRIVKSGGAGNSTIIGGCRRFDRKDVGVIISPKFWPYFNDMITKFLGKLVIH